MSQADLSIHGQVSRTSCDRSNGGARIPGPREKNGDVAFHHR